jgi:hypothetical protein
MSHTTNKYKSFVQVLDLLAAYKEEHGHVCVPIRYTVGGYSLGKRVSKLRYSYKKGTLSEETIEVLESMGFNWTMRGISECATVRTTYTQPTGHGRGFGIRMNFGHVLLLLTRYKEEHGHLCVPQHYKTDDYGLGARVASRRGPGGGLGRAGF